jgi:hypothetical protein
VQSQAPQPVTVHVSVPVWPLWQKQLSVAPVLHAGTLPSAPASAGGVSEMPPPPPLPHAIDVASKPATPKRLIPTTTSAR